MLSHYYTTPIIIYFFIYSFTSNFFLRLSTHTYTGIRCLKDVFQLQLQSLHYNIFQYASPKNSLMSTHISSTPNRQACPQRHL